MQVLQALTHLVTSAILSVGFFLSALFSSHTSAVVQNQPQVATTTAPAALQATSTRSTTPPPLSALKIIKSTPKAKTPTTGSVALPTTPTQTPPTTTVPTVPARPIGDVNAETRLSLVNILCTTRGGGYFLPISGSGVMVDGRGVVLTNAHVAQYFLLHDFPTPDNVECVVRTGSPASPTYHAELLYLPPQWIADNASQIAASQGMGTGENDFAFLRLTTRADNSPLSGSVHSILVSIEPPERGESVLLASYPAGFLDGQSIIQQLYASSAVTTIDNIYTFTDDTTHADLASMGGTVVAQAGSSGGAMVRASDGALQGIIATDTEGTTTASRELRAVTLSHIDRALASFGEGGIIPLLSGDIAAKAAAFNTQTAPALTQKLEAVLKK